jgi:fructose-1-phosphate kinase PfkB-like protein
VETGSGDEYTITAPTLSAEERHLPLLIQRVQAHADRAWGLVCAGSLPKGLPKDSYVQILRSVRQQGLVTLLDASGDSLRHGVAGLPHILKVNHLELAALDSTFQPHADTVAASKREPPNLSVFAAKLANQLGALAIEAIVISMGRHGALAVTQTGRFYAGALDVPVAVTNGAGDAMNAGLMLARKRGEDWPDALRLGAAAAAASVMHPGTSGCDPAQVERLLPQVSVSTVQ